MLGTLLQMFALIGLGLLWAAWRPGGHDLVTVRKLLTDSVYYVFLPALVLRVLWQTPLGAASFQIAASAAAGVLIAVALSILVCRACRSDRSTAGAMILAASWPNATYLGLPVLESTFGPWARSVAIQYDLFASTPLLLTLGIVIASRYGYITSRAGSWTAVFKVPPLWAALAAVALQSVAIEPNAWLLGLLDMLASPVVPLMLISIGMALPEGFRQWKHLPGVIPVIVIQLLLMPLAVWWVSMFLGLKGELHTAVVLEAAMPSMVLGVVLCDRYGLNTGVYAAALSATTLLALATLPLWHLWAG